MLYSNQTKQQLGQQTYAGINANRMVKIKSKNQKEYYFYIN